MIRKIARTYINIEVFVTNFLMIGVVIFVFLAAVMRWAGFPIAWSVEAATLMFVWVIFLGANRALREDRHIGVDFFTKRLSLKVRVVVEIIINLISISFLVTVGMYGIMLSLENSERLISNLPLSYSWVTSAVPVGCLLMVITLLIKISNQIQILRQKGEK